MAVPHTHIHINEGHEMEAALSHERLWFEYSAGWWFLLCM